MGDPDCSSRCHKQRVQNPKLAREGLTDATENGGAIPNLAKKGLSFRIGLKKGLSF